MPTTLDAAVKALGRLAPVELAEDWDNVGLLLAPTAPRPLKKVLLTIDLTAGVLEEALKQKAGLVVAYHPPIFQPLKRLDPADPRHRLLLRLIEERIALYSPHTALDAVPGGVNDWLASGLGEAADIRPIGRRHRQDPRQKYKLVVFVPAEHVDRLRHELASRAGAGWIGAYSHCSFNLSGYGTFWGHEGTNPAVGTSGRIETADEVRLEMVASEAALTEAARVIDEVHPYEEPAWEIYRLESPVLAGAGAGRIVQLAEPAPLSVLVRRIKKHLGLKTVKLAQAPGLEGKLIELIALCPGAGGSLLAGIQADLYLTGEMRHHDVLAANAAGAHVVLTDHTPGERGYLPLFADNLAEALGKGVEVVCSKEDEEPLKTV